MISETITYVVAPMSMYIVQRARTLMELQITMFSMSICPRIPRYDKITFNMPVLHPSTQITYYHAALSQLDGFSIYVPDL